MKLCWLYEKAISRAVDAGTQTPAWVNRHLDKCIECHQCYQAHVRLTAALTASAQSQVTSPSSFLHARIMSALDQEAGRAETPGRILQALRSILIPAFGLFIIGVLWIWKSESPNSAQQPAVSSLVVMSERVAPARSGVDAAKLLEWSENLDQPLKSEFQLVVDDAKSALSSLSDNFLPHGLGGAKEF
jgi:anti-sigma factor RsiW